MQPMFALPADLRAWLLAYLGKQPHDKVATAIGALASLTPITVTAAPPESATHIE